MKAEDANIEMMGVPSSDAEEGNNHPGIGYDKTLPLVSTKAEAAGIEEVEVPSRNAKWANPKRRGL